MTRRTCPHCHLDIDPRVYARHVTAAHTKVCSRCGVACLPHTNNRANKDIRTHMHVAHGIRIVGRDYDRTTAVERARSHPMTMEERESVCAAAYQIIDAAHVGMIHMPWER